MSGLNCPPLTSDGDIWTEKAAVIRQLYICERKTLKQVKEILEREHEFPIFSLSTYETTLRDKLRLRKKLKRTQWPIVYHHYQNRAGKATGLYLNGERIPWNKAWKEIRRSGARSISDISRPAPLPEGVVVRTPSPVIRPVSPALPGLRGGLHSASFPPTQTQLLAQNETPSIDFQDHPHASTILPTRGNLHSLSLGQYTSQLANETGTMTGTHNFDMSFYRSFLQTTPWNQFNKKIRSLFGYAAQPSDLRNLSNGRAFRGDITADFTHFMPSSLVGRIGLPNTTPLLRFNGDSEVPALNFSSYHFLTQFLRLFSNKIDILDSPSIDRHVLKYFDILLGELPNAVLLKLLKSGLPTIRAVWEASVPLAFRVRHKRAFSLLMEVGVQHPNWILGDASTYLSLAASMGCINTIRGLLRIGVRADDAFPKATIGRQPPLSAILEAAIAGHVDCVEELIQGCDVNRIIKYSCGGVSNFDIFVSAIMLRKIFCMRWPTINMGAQGWDPVNTSLEYGVFSPVLDIFLDSGANVDLLWRGIPDAAICKFQDANDIPMQWKLSLLEQSFYCDTELYDKLRLYSAKERTLETTRLGICLSAKRGKEFLQAYLDSRPRQHPADRTKLLELVLAEQFLPKDRRVIDLEIIRGLVDFGVDVNFPNLELGFHTSSHSSLLLYNLIVKSRLSGFTKDVSTFVNLLISKGAIIDADVVQAAVAEVGLGVLPELSNHGADIKTHGGFALCTAARWNNFEAVSWLLQIGVDINADINRMNWKMARTIIATASLYIFYPFCTEEEDFRESYHSELSSWGSAGIEMLGYLIRRGAKLRLNSQYPSHFHFLKDILTTHDDDMLLLDKMKLFLNFIAIPEDVATTDETLLELCLAHPIANGSYYERVIVYELLLSRGCRVLRGAGIAHYILNGGRHEIIYKVLDAGADVNTCSRRIPNRDAQLYPLGSAAMRGDLELVMQLLQKGATLNQPPLGYRGRTALQSACEWPTLSTEERTRKMDLIRFLINQGADVNTPAARVVGMTALQIAALYGDIELALVLLEHGANPNAPPAKYGGYCALDAAASRGGLDMVDLLLSAAAHSYHRGQSGYEGAIKLATKRGHFAVVDIIREHTRLFGNCIIADLNDDEGPSSDDDEGSSSDDDEGWLAEESESD
ncbi:hypothetical protein F4680DRAFT_424863 [Xylaria scruposa]|nr:hypothetical protein F4680DRAFT_424863 [Xylaria scruposa]